MRPRALVVLGRSTDLVALKRKAFGSLDKDGADNTRLATLLPQSALREFMLFDRLGRITAQLNSSHAENPVIVEQALLALAIGQLRVVKRSRCVVSLQVTRRDHASSDSALQASAAMAAEPRSPIALTAGATCAT